ncbi:ABC transporter ATP-binding protein [Rothia sp. ZJ932]|nr:ABC transporter ATP-binding protein [Rothia sp. ZJ932]
MNTVTRYAAVSTSHLSQSFHSRSGTVDAVRDVSFSIAPGEIVALLGENGAGKSTLIDMLLGLASPASGSVTVFGTAPRAAIQNSQVTAVLQSGGLLKDLSVKDQVAMVAATYPHAPDVQAVLETAGIADIARRKIGKCSGGQQQKIRFALALLGNPDLLILDEPTTGMDVNARASFWSSMRAQAATGKTIIFATHYLEEAEDFADRALVLADGQLVADGRLEDLRARAGFREVSFNLDDTAPLELTQQHTHDWGISHLRCADGRYTLRCALVEEFLTYLLPRQSISNLEVIQPSLADVFTKLTGNPSK